MEKRKWLWKRRPSDKSPGETESSGSVSSYSERCSDEQEVLKESPNHSTQSPEVTSKAAISSDDLNGSVKSLTEKLSAALVNVSAKEDLVKQHAKVAEEAVAGWEKAENEVAVLKQQLESAVQQNLSLEVRVSHLDGALKECVKQLRQAREEQEQRIRQWESTQADLQNRLNDLQNQTQPEFPSSIDSDILLKLEALEKENSSLKLELISRSEELEIMTLERDLSTQTAEIASKQQLESIKKLAKLEAECRKLQATARKSSNNNNNDEQFKNEKTMSRSLTTCSVDIDMMDDFLEMERLAAALPDTKNKTLHIESTVVKEEDNESMVEVEKMSHWVAELEEKLSGLEMEKAQLEADLNECQEFLGESRVRLSEAETEMEELKREITAMNDAKELLEFQLVGVEVEARTLSEDVGSLKVEVEKEKGLSEELKAKCRELEEELMRKNQEAERQVAANTIVEQKVKQEDLAIAASKLADCQKTIASLGRQLKSLATLEDFLIDTANLPGFSSEEEWKLHSNDSYIQKTDFDQSKAPTVEDSPTPLPENHRGAGSLKGRNGFSVLFSRGKTGDST